MTLTDTIDEYATDLASDHLITLLQRQGWTDEQINTAADAIGEMFALAMEPAEIVGLRNATGAITARCGHLAAASATVAYLAAAESVARTVARLGVGISDQD
jgi:hypothetical protein